MGNRRDSSKDIQDVFLNCDNIKLAQFYSYSQWKLYICADDCDGPLTLIFDDPQQSFHCHEQGVPPGCIWMEQTSSTFLAASVDLPHLFQSALHFPNVEWYTFLYTSLDVAFIASTIAIRLSRWQGRRNSKPSSSFRSADTSTNSTSLLRCITITFDCIVLLIFSKNLESFSEIRTIICSQNLTTNFKLGIDIIQGVCQHIECVRTFQLCARAAEYLVRLSGSIQCTVTPMKRLLLTDQQSVVVAIWSTTLMASVTAFFIPLRHHQS